MEQYKIDFIHNIIRAEVLRFGEFTTKSGRKSPYFINTGNFRTGRQISELGEAYASCLRTSVGDAYDVLFGPAYKGIPLVTATAGALYRLYGIDKPFCFNRKEEKDHGEGGNFVGAKLRDGDRVVLIEDVVTSGAAVREVMPQLKAAAALQVTDMVISVDRMEVGPGGRTAKMELLESYGIRVHAIVTVREIIEYLYGREIEGKVYLDDERRTQMETYISKYCEK